MKIKNTVFILILTSLFLSIGTQAQNSNKEADAIIFEEDFNGWSDISSEGWFTYNPQSSNWVSPDGESITFFKQVDADWMILISPEIDLTNATMLTFLHKRGSSVDGQKLEVGVMSDPTDPSTFQLLNIVDINNPEWTSEGTETALGGISGLTHIAFNVSASSPPPYTYFFFDDVLITDEGGESNWPGYITDLEIDPAAEGANHALVSWTNPAVEADGDPLTDLDSTVILRNDEWVHTIYNPSIGGDEQIQIDVLEAGLYVFTITCYNDEGASVSIYNDPPVWIGLDTPGIPENIVLTVTDNTITDLSWSAPTIGAHGAYFDGIVETYKIVRADGFEYTVQGDVLSFTQEINTPGTYNYSVSGINESGEGEASNSNTGAYYFNGYLLAEDFWVSVPALDWNLEGESTDTWYHWPTDYSGGNFWEMIFYADQSAPFTGISRAVSPIINSIGFNALTLKFRQSQNWNAGSYVFKVQTTSDGGANWNEAWSITVDESSFGKSELVVIDNTDVGSENFQFSFTFEGNSANLEFLTVDDVWLYESSEVDLVAMEIVLPELIQPDENISPIANIESWGYLETDFTAVMTFYEGNDVVYSSEISSTIEGGADMELIFEIWLAEEGSYQAEFIITAIDDEFPNNNTLYKNFNVLYLNAERTLVVCEEATGTWCGYCPGAAMGLDDLVQNGWPVAVVAYHGSDAYETIEGRDRLDYYEMDGFPTVNFDGIVSYAGGSGSESLYDTYLPIVQERLSIPAAASIDIDEVFIYEGHLHATISITSGSPIVGDQIVLQSVFTESHIPESWQGMDELDYVERNMYQGAGGVILDLSDQTEEVNISIAIDPSWLTENGELVVFIQNLDDQEIYNGNKIDLIMVAVDNIERWVAVYPNPTTDYFTIKDCATAEINLYSMQGQKVLTENIVSNNAQIDVSSLEFGTYLLEIIIDGKRFSKKVLKSK
ncbi:MAG: T9SS type A sorting domain-containing protein [Bacteroidales bacterium]|nr:T9SS type A sorting domain-containing protein [Bacteroidales bacterium]